MKRTNYSYYKFLDFNPDLPGNEGLWKACSPLDIVQEGTDIVVFIPFQKQKCENNLEPELITPREYYRMKLRAYGDKIIRVAISFNGECMCDSELLDLNSTLEINPLNFEKTEAQWIIRDNNGIKRAVFNFKDPIVDSWSKLIPPPEDVLLASFFPDGKKGIVLSEQAAFFPLRNDSHALTCIENDGQMSRAGISIQSNSTETFMGMDGNNSKKDLGGQTFQFENNSTPLVNGQTHINTPFFISNRMYGIYLHSKSGGKMSFVSHSSRSVKLLAKQKVLDLFMVGGQSAKELFANFKQVVGCCSQYSTKELNEYGPVQFALSKVI